MKDRDDKGRSIALEGNQPIEAGSTEARLVFVENGLANAVFAADLRHRRALFSPLQNKRLRRLSEYRCLHRSQLLSQQGKFSRKSNDRIWVTRLDQAARLSSVEDARLKCEAYRHEYNHDRQHSSIGNKTPIEFMKAISTTCSLMA